ncbi:YL1 nuclear protein-domain-containing protein [Pyronema omphalodes]|nr:YL1 nuclear protein-domain-containing protein [Pyronema omphalodes]
MSESDSDSELTSLLSDPENSTAATPAAPAPVVESLVAGRARRANAGNLLAKLLTQEIDEEDTLFMEDEDDVEFEVNKKDLQDDDDALMDSSSDSENEAAGADQEFEGEKEIERQEKEAKKARKRKADDAFMKPRKERKKAVTIAPEVTEEDTGTGTELDADGYNALTRPRKKSERISWVPEFVATRASSRTLSLQNRSETMRRLEESQKRRLHTIALMEKAAAKKEKVRPKKEMTQAERLEEAKLTERRNLRSLCSWQETEQQKLEEQRQRLLALQNRKLAGPVITYWSGPAEWNGETGKLVRVGKGKLIEEIEEDEAGEEKKKKRIRKPKPKEGEKATEEKGQEVVKDEKGIAAVGDASAKKADVSENTPVVKTETDKEDTNQPEDADAISPKSLPQPPVPQNRQTLPNNVEIKDADTPMSNFSELSSLPPSEQPTPMAITPITSTFPPPLPPLPTDTPLPPTAYDVPLPPPPPPKPNEISARNLIVLENFEPSLVRDKAALIKTLWGDQTRRLPTTKPYCVISHQPAKFRDPATGMPFASLKAYQDIRRLLHGEIRWSCLLDAYVGETGLAAKGVPEGF